MKKFIRTRAAPAPPPPPPAPRPSELPKTNGHANGGARRDDHSTLSSRYWEGSAGSAEAPWEDPEFPAGWRALGERRRASSIVWKRPHELSARPTFWGAEEAEGEGAEGWEVELGALGSAALCAAAAALATAPRLLARVAPPHALRKPYSGAVRFRFWVFGTWREVVVDDRLPCRAGRLLASRARAHDYMLPLLEKAYAKLYGSYAAMRAQTGGEEGAARALQELSGGVVQSFSLARQPRPLTLQVLRAAAPRSTLVVASPAAGRGRACCVTGLAEGAAGALVRVRAVGGAPGPRGARPPGTPHWRALADVDRELLDARAPHPDEFWMSFNEFASVFSRLELVHVGPDDWVREPALRARRPWRAVLARRRWRKGYNAGGPPDALETTGCNPQFHVQIPGARSGDKCHVVVSVTQQYSPRAPRPRLRAVGFALYALPARRALDATHCSRAREVATFFTLPPGEYLLVPHTRRAHTEAAFLLRVFTDQHANIWEVNEDNIILRDISCEFPDEREPLPPEVRTTLVKLFGKDEVEEVDAEALRAALRRGGAGRAPRALCRALLALRDKGVRGRAAARDVPALLRVLAGWRAVLAREAGACACGASSYRLRALLRAAGVSASNKVLEACVARFAPRAVLTADCFLLALARIYLAHERYRSLDTKLKSNPLSLEEMILMTIYS